MSSKLPDRTRLSLQGRVAAVVTFAIAVVLSLVAATSRPGDSAHAMGIISTNGGAARHPVHLPAGGDRCMLVVTATVLPPYHGDVEVAVEGDSAPDFTVRASAPVIDLGVRRIPRFRDGAFRGLEPRDRLAMWVSIKPPPLDPVCGHPRAAGFLESEHEGRRYWFCSADCRDAFVSRSDRPTRRGALEGSYRIVFRDAASRRPVLTVPVIFGSGGGHGHEH